MVVDGNCHIRVKYLWKLCFKVCAKHKYSLLIFSGVDLASLDVGVDLLFVDGDVDLFCFGW